MAKDVISGAGTKVLVGLLFAPQVIQGVLSMYPPFSSGLARKAYGDTPNLVPPPSELVGQRLKGLITSENYTNLMMEAGYSPKHAELMVKNARGYLSALDYVTAWRREELNETDLDHLLGEMGLNTNDIDTFKKVTIYYPTPQDLIRFAVRDVYSPNTIKTYGLDEDYPALLDSNAAKAGLPSEIAHWYWMAHWELPSPTQVYDMFHRKIITYEDAKLYLKNADYMPYWRDKLLQLSYDNIGRIDLRHMFAMGFLTESELSLRYQSIGYSPEDSDLLVKYDVAQGQHSNESNASSVVIASYKAGTIDRPQALEQLRAMKTSDDLASTLLDNADATIKQELIDLEADAIIDQYQQGLIDLDGVKTQLTMIGVPARMLQLTIQRELVQARKRVKRSTKADLDTWWKQGVIGHVKYTEKMKGLGYQQGDITLYLSELELAELAEKERKYAWANVMREYSDGAILGDGLEAGLRQITGDESLISHLMEIAKSAKN